MPRCPCAGSTYRCGRRCASCDSADDICDCRGRPSRCYHHRESLTQSEMRNRQAPFITGEQGSSVPRAIVLVCPSLFCNFGQQRIARNARMLVAVTPRRFPGAPTRACRSCYHPHHPHARGHRGPIRGQRGAGTPHLRHHSVGGGLPPSQQPPPIGPIQRRALGRRGAGLLMAGRYRHDQPAGRAAGFAASGRARSPGHDAPGLGGGVLVRCRLRPRLGRRGGHSTRGRQQCRAVHRVLGALQVPEAPQ